MWTADRLTHPGQGPTPLPRCHSNRWSAWKWAIETICPRVLGTSFMISVTTYRLTLEMLGWWTALCRLHLNQKAVWHIHNWAQRKKHSHCTRQACLLRLYAELVETSVAFWRMYSSEKAQSASSLGFQNLRTLRKFMRWCLWWVNQFLCPVHMSSNSL